MKTLQTLKWHVIVRVANSRTIRLETTARFCSHWVETSSSSSRYKSSYLRQYLRHWKCILWFTFGTANNLTYGWEKIMVDYIIGYFRWFQCCWHCCWEGPLSCKKILHQQSPKILFWETLGWSGVTWRSLWKMGRLNRSWKVRNMHDAITAIVGS